MPTDATIEITVRIQSDFVERFFYLANIHVCCYDRNLLPLRYLYRQRVHVLYAVEHYNGRLHGSYPDDYHRGPSCAHLGEDECALAHRAVEFRELVERHF